eukprot:COSAG02_NODE_7102_length_3185_cov_1.583603_2_plen_74_part_00
MLHTDLQQLHFCHQVRYCRRKKLRMALVLSQVRCSKQWDSEKCSMILQQTISHVVCTYVCVCLCVCVCVCACD